MFAALGWRGDEALRQVRAGEAGGGIRLAAPGARAAGQLLPAAPRRLQAGALRREQARYIEQARRRRREVFKERIGFILEYLRAHPCADCGEADPLVLELTI